MSQKTQPHAIEGREVTDFSAPLEIWGGAEYTCNRVGDRYLDQMKYSGHAHRWPDDYARIAALGIRKLRIGLLWERHEADQSWRCFDEHLACLTRHRIRPIAGLVHHGSGPPHTGLLDSAFPEKLAAYAGRVAERYPWIDAYTPVNEPNTTARFSGMYGLWYPHARSRASYLRALVNQLKGTVLSMQAIRRVRPDAQLIQTDDVGRISGTEALRSTWELLNIRQWLAFDLLCGKVTHFHPMFAYMLQGGISEREIYWFSEHPCPPDILGLNYYVTSDRYLDHRIDQYPIDRRSSEGRFVDVEAVRVDAAGLAGIDSLLLEACDKYHIPMAVTEVHLGGHEEEQIRWLVEAWAGIARARAGGADCRAFTVWALLGSFYWNQLVTCENGHYESGAFDISTGIPVPTQLATVVAQIARGEAPYHPCLSHAGWWGRDTRIAFPWKDGRRDMAA